VFCPIARSADCAYAKVTLPVRAGGIRARSASACDHLMVPAAIEISAFPHERIGKAPESATGSRSSVSLYLSANVEFAVLPGTFAAVPIR